MSESRQARYSRRESQFGAEIGEIPKVVNQRRRDLARNSLQHFCEFYRPQAFSLGWSKDHVRVISCMERALTGHGLFALAMPRGSGKTTLAVTASIWSLLYGHQRWVCLIGATESSSISLLKSIKTELRFNPLLLEDFPEVCYPIVKLEGRATRATAQTSGGANTNISWLANELVFPMVEGSVASGAVVSCVGITGEIRGQVKTLSDGTIIRPTVVIPDDPQTRESALSSTQTKQRLETLAGDILGLGGPGVRVSAIMPCTVICKNDMADQILSGKWPGWNVERTMMLYGEMKNPQFVDQYFEIRRDEIFSGGDGSESNKFYVDNQSEIEEGFRAAWDKRYNTDTEVSAIQHALNIMFRDEGAFRSEYQNDPEETSDQAMMTVDEIASKVSSTGRLVIPHGADHVVGFVDVQKNALYYVVAAFADNFTGTVIDYGIFPEQGTNNVSYRNLRRGFEDIWPGEGLESHLVKALDTLSSKLMDHDYKSERGSEYRIERLLIDANWGQSTGIVYKWIRGCRWRQSIFPSHGKFVGASTEPLNASASSRKGARLGDNWRVAQSKSSPQRHVIYDSNYWKSFMHQRIATYPGVSGSLDLYQAKGSQHMTFAGHLRSEYATKKEGRGRIVDEWKIRPGVVDNHWLDCLAGCCVAASISGCVTSGPSQIRKSQSTPRRERKSKIIKASEL